LESSSFATLNFSSFTCVTCNEVSKLWPLSLDTNCDMDPTPKTLLQQCSHILRPTITNIIYMTISILAFFIISSNTVHLKQSNLDKDDLGNYRPISHLSSMSNLTEKAVNLRLADYQQFAQFIPMCTYLTLLANLLIVTRYIILFFLNDFKHGLEFLPLLSLASTLIY